MLRCKHLGAAPQQLLSLLQWRQALASSDVAGAYSRGVATQPQAANRFSKERKEYETSLAELRKQWAQERQERQAEQAAKAAAQREAREAAKARRAQQLAAEKTSKKAEYLAKQQEDRQLRLAAKAVRLQRQQLREEVLDVAREERRTRLLQTSKRWITADTLDARIAEALDHPVSLFPEASPAGGPGAGKRGGGPAQQQEDAAAAGAGLEGAVAEQPAL